MPVEARVEPRVLVWSRETAGLSVDAAAHLISVSPEKLASWEGGAANPTIGQVRKMAEKYKRPLNAFFLPTPPASNDATLDLPDFRVLGDDAPRLLSRDAIFALRKMRDWRLDILDLYADLDLTVPTFDWQLPNGENAEEAGVAVRDFLGVSLELQLGWRRDSAGHAAFNGWRDAIEANNILVFQATGVRLAELRGVSRFERQFPSMLLNTADTVRGRIFTLLHEFTHLALHGSSLCDPSSARPSSRRQDPVEVFCNAVAGSALIPAAVIEREPLLAAVDRNAPDDSVFNELAAKYSVSRFVVLRRLLAVGRISDEVYADRHKLWSASIIGSSPASSGGDGRRTNLSQRGRHFTRTVISAYRADRITRAESARLLGLKPDDLSLAVEYARL
jgi:Zn-dependent peptidase ImmA (M78 family)/transcriptional regulator with XRE-family HTH domain